MPKCLNSKIGNYKGTEPSPKGIGYCAHGEKVGTKMVGLDKNMWIVKQYNKSKRWINYDENSINEIKPKTAQPSKGVAELATEVADRVIAVAEAAKKSAAKKPAAKKPATKKDEPKA